MRKRLTLIACVVCTAASLGAMAQTAPAADKVQSPSTSCSGTLEPPPYEVWVFADANFKGKCAALSPGFYPNSGTGYGTFGLPNDSISSLKVGVSARARLFSDGVYGGSYFWFGAGLDYPGMPSGWNDSTSSIRVEIGARSTICNDLQAGEYALFRNVDRGGDCVVLHYKNVYPEPVDLGIANDSVSSIDSGPNIRCLSGPYAGWGNGFWLFRDGLNEGDGSGGAASKLMVSGDGPYNLPPLYDNLASAATSLCTGADSP